MNYAELFRVTLPETVLEVAALLVLIVDLSLLRNAAIKKRAAGSALVGVAGCVVALWTMSFAGAPDLTAGSDVLLSAGGTAGVAQAGIARSMK